MRSSSLIFLQRMFASPSTFQVSIFRSSASPLIYLQFCIRHGDGLGLTMFLIIFSPQKGPFIAYHCDSTVKFNILCTFVTVSDQRRPKKSTLKTFKPASDTNEDNTVPNTETKESKTTTKNHNRYNQKPTLGSTQPAFLSPAAFYGQRYLC